MDRLALDQAVSVVLNQVDILTQIIRKRLFAPVSCLKPMVHMGKRRPTLCAARGSGEARD